MTSYLLKEKISKTRALIVTIFAFLFYAILTKPDIALQHIFDVISKIVGWSLSQLLSILQYFGFLSGPLEWSFGFTLRLGEVEYYLIWIVYLGVLLALIHFYAHISVKEVGLRKAVVKKGYRFWILSTIIFAIVIAVFYIITVNVAHVFGYQLPYDAVTTETLSLDDLFQRLIWWPIIEELVFRGVLLTVLSIFFGWQPVIIIINGVTFAVAHFYYGSPDPFNFVGGYFLAWIFYKTRSLTLPILFHSLGNVFCLGCAFLNTYYPNVIDKAISLFTI